MDNELYRELIIEHASNPRNAGTIEHPDFFGEEVNPACGDEIRLYLKLEDGKVSDVKHASKGCAISQASVSLLTEKMRDMTKGELSGITKEDALACLGVPLGTMRLRCALLSLEALRRALRNPISDEPPSSLSKTVGD